MIEGTPSPFTEVCMSSVEHGEYFEDWYVVSSESKRFGSFDDAIWFVADECTTVIK